MSWEISSAIPISGSLRNETPVIRASGAAPLVRWWAMNIFPPPDPRAPREWRENPAFILACVAAGGWSLFVLVGVLSALNASVKWTLAAPIGLVLVGWLAAFAYFAPSMTAYRRNHHNAAPILALNLLLGWSGLGWIIAMIWALTSRPGDLPR